MGEYWPLPIVSGVHVGGKIEFQHPKRKLTVESHADIVWAILRLCNGITKSDAIVAKATRQTGSSRELIAGILDDLTSLGILVDSRKVYSHFHELGNNLLVYSSELTPREVHALQTSSHLPWKDGEETHIVSGQTSQVARLGMERHSCRNFGNESVSAADFSELLRVAYSKALGVSPSAGGMYPLRIYVLLMKQVGIFFPGLYEYNDQADAITLYDRTLDEQELRFAFDSETLLYGAPVIMVIAAELGRQPAKYANRGYRYSLIEAGHVAQSIHLVAHELHLATLEYGGFQDDVLSRALSLDQGMVPLVAVAVGKKGAESQDGVSLAVLADQLTTDLVGKGKPVNRVWLVNAPRTAGDYSFFQCLSHFRPGNQDDARASYAERICGGTAVSVELATVKAIAEGYERHRSGIPRVDEVAAAAQLQDLWLDPRVYAPYSDIQVDAHPNLDPFDPAVPWEWAEGLDLLTDERILAPIDLVFYPLSGRKLGRNLCHFASSNGVAAHVSYDRAIQSALLELIERDAIMRNWFQKESLPKVPVNSLPLHWRKRIRHWADKGYEVEVVDMSHDGVAIVSVIVHSDTLYPHFVSGTSASIESLEAAYTKAFHEAEVGLITHRQHGERRMTPQELIHPLDHGNLYAQHRNQGSVDFLWQGCYRDPVDPSATLESLMNQYQPCMVDLSGNYQRLRVVRVFARDLVPVNFGYGLEHHTHESLPDSVRSRHFSELEPHYLA